VITPRFIQEKLIGRQETGALRQLSVSKGIDFSSNDYLGLARSKQIAENSERILRQFPGLANGSSGSRLIAGHSELADYTENLVARFHEGESALIYNSGYDANVGFFPCIAGRGDTILYDYLSHASIRDGIRLSHARAFSFEHNHIADLESKLSKAEGNIFVAVESIYSMDGDAAPLQEISRLCQKYSAYLIVDEAHSTGVFGRGKGLTVEFGLQDKVFARLHTFGKAMGCHGAAWLINQELKDYLINFSRSFIYTTALPPPAFATIASVYEQSSQWIENIDLLFSNIRLFTALVSQGPELLPSLSPIQGWLLKSNQRAVQAANHIAEKGFAVKPIRYPTVPEGTERIRIVLHAFNSEDEIRKLADAMLSFCNNQHHE